MKLRGLNEMNIARVTFWQIFRFIFVIFCLYLLGDAFYRWDGFSYYASFSEFLPAVALVLILLSLLVFILSIGVWLFYNLFHVFCKLFNLKISLEHLLLYTAMFIVSGLLIWKGKRILWHDVQTPIQVKSAVFLCVAIISIIGTYLLRRSAGRWVTMMQERITPLVWLFGFLLVLSIPLVAYHTWLKGTDNLVLTTAEEDAPEQKARPNIILVTFDAMSARNMSLYGYQRDTTPFIQKWAKEATVFNMAESGSNFTTPATASLVTGKRVWTHQIFHIEGTKPVNSRTESLPALLKSKGYFNMAFVVNPHVSVNILGMSDSFDIAPLASDFSEPASLISSQFGTIDVFLYRLFGNKVRKYNWILENDFILKKLLRSISGDYSMTTVPPEKAFNRFLKEVDSLPNRNFFAWIHVFPPHDPYLPPDPYRHMFNGSSEFRTYKTQEHMKLEAYKYLFQYRRFPDEMQSAVDLMKDYYDEFIRYSDKRFEEFILEIDKRGMGNTIIILSSDHGESFEHGYFTHGGPFLYEQVTHVPLIIKEPAQNTGQVVSGIVEQIDIPATILDLADIPVPSWMEGRSLVPLMRGEKIQSKPVFSMNFEENPSRGHQINRGSIAVWEGDYKLIHYLEEKKSLLFNLLEDPGEVDNLINKEPVVGKHLIELIQDNLNKANKKILKER